MTKTKDSTYNWNPTAMERLPKTVSELLDRGDKTGKCLSREQREAVAEGLLKSGVHKAINLKWMALLVRYRLGVGNYPTPPSSLAEEALGYKLAQGRADEIVQDVEGAHGRAR